MSKIWVINIKDTRKEYEKTSPLSKEQFCLRKKIIGIGWGNEVELSDNEKSTNYLNALNSLKKIEIGDMIWIKWNLDYYIAVAKSQVIISPKDYHDYDISNHIMCDFYKIGIEFPKELEEYKNKLVAHSTIQEKPYDEKFYNTFEAVLNTAKMQNENSKSIFWNFLRNKKRIISIFISIVILLTIIISGIVSSDIEAEHNAIKEKIITALSGKRFSAIEGSELYIVNVNNNGKFSTEAYKLSEDANYIVDRLWGDPDYSDSYSDLAVTVSSKYDYYTAIGYPIFENERVIGLEKLSNEDYYKIKGKTAQRLSYDLITYEQEIMIDEYIVKETTNKVELNELLPTCKEFLQKSIEKGYLSAEAHTDFSKNYIDIRIKKDSSSAFTMSLNITYPNAQTPYSDAKITGIKITNISSLSLPNYDLPKYIIPYLEVFPNSLFKEKDLIKTIKDKGKTTSEIHNAPKASYNDNKTTYTLDGITYTYTEQIITTETTPFYKSLEVTIDTDYTIFLDNYPEYSVGK